MEKNKQVIKNVIDGMAKAIHKEFGSEYKIYTEAVKQGLKAPCFFIGCTESAEEEKLARGPSDGRYLRRQKMEVLYLPKNKNKEYKGEYNDVTDRLYDALYYIDHDGELIRGTELKSSTAEGILVFSVVYEFFVIRTQEDKPEFMEREKTHLKNIFEE